MNAPSFLTWLAGTLLPLGTLWLVYRLALRGERCFGYNRTLLVLAPLLAAALPLLPHPALPLWLSGPAVVAGKTSVTVLLPAVAVGQVAAPAGGWSVGMWLAAVYLAGVALGLGRLAWQAGRLRQLARRLPRKAHPGYVLAYTSGQLPTSSFGRVIFWDETAALAPAEAAAVLRHELAHVQQRHTLDVLWLEAWRAVLWPNPFSHLLLPALRLTHELLADAAATTEALEPNATPYPTLLARLATRQLGGPVYSALLQPFTFSFTLTRIAMLQNQIPVRRWKQWLVLPLLGGVFLVACRTSKEDAVQPLVDKEARRATFIANVKEAMRQDSLRTGKGWQDNSKILHVDKDGSVTITHQPDVPAPPVPATSPQAANAEAGHVYTYVEQMPQLPGGGNVAAIMQAIQSKLVYPQSAVAATTTGRVFASFTVEADGTVDNARIIKGLTSECDNAVLAAIQQLPRFEPGKQAGKPVAVSFTVPIKFEPKP